jgi:hypothetical protein
MWHHCKPSEVVVPSQEDIDNQKTLLASHRRTLAHYLRQEALLGAAHTPPGVVHGIYESRQAIQRMKAALRSWNVAIDDLPDDDEFAPSLLTPFAEEADDQRHLKVFLCHSSGDKPAIRNLYQRLRAEGIAPWLDEEDLIPGQDWQQEIPKVVRTADIVIVCLSRGSITKAGYVQKEIKQSLDVADEQPEGAIFIIPLKIEECDVPERLRRWHWVDFFEERGYERLMRALRTRALAIGITTIKPEETIYELTPEYQMEEISLSPEVIARKGAEDLLLQGVSNWRRFGTLLSEEVRTLIDAQRDRLQLRADEQELLRLSTMRHARQRAALIILGGILGGALGGLVAGISEFFGGKGVGNGIIGLVLGGILAGVLLGGGISFGIGLNRAFGGQRWIFSVLTAAVMGMLLGGISFLQLGVPTGALYGSGIALSVVLGNTFKKGTRILALVFMGIFVGILVALLLPHPANVPWIILFTAVGITVGVGVLYVPIQTAGMNIFSVF